MIDTVYPANGYSIDIVLGLKDGNKFILHDVFLRMKAIYFKLICEGSIYDVFISKDGSRSCFDLRRKVHIDQQDRIFLFP